MAGKKIPHNTCSQARTWSLCFPKSLGLHSLFRQHRRQLNKQTLFSIALSGNSWSSPFWNDILDMLISEYLYSVGVLSSDCVYSNNSRWKIEWVVIGFINWTEETDTWKKSEIMRKCHVLYHTWLPDPKGSRSIMYSNV